MGVKKKLQLTSLLGLSLFIMTACATNGTASDITEQQIRQTFGVNSSIFLLKLSAFCPLTLVSEWGLSSLRS